MATQNVEQRTTKNGIRYRARVRIRTDKTEKGYYEESKTFKARATAKNWAKNRAKLLDVEGIPQNTENKSEYRDVSLSTLIEMYLAEFDDRLGRSKKFALKAIAKRDIGIFTVSSLTKDHIIDYAKERRKEGVSGYTVYQDIIYIKSAVGVAQEKEFQVNGNTDFILEAIKKFKGDFKSNTPKSERLIEFKADERVELPTKSEMELLRAELKKRQEHRSAKIPFLDILDFAIATCMRVSEICRIQWGDFNKENMTIMIRDRKHPTEKAGNNVLVPLISGSFELLSKKFDQHIKELKEEGKVYDMEDLVFPFNPRSVTAGWQRCRKKVIEDGNNIQNIRFHDLRAYGASLLMDKGWPLSKVSKVTGHRDINVLNNIYNRLDITKIALEDFNDRHNLKQDKETEN